MCFFVCCRVCRLTSHSRVRQFPRFSNVRMLYMPYIISHHQGRPNKEAELHPSLGKFLRTPSRPRQNKVLGVEKIILQAQGYAWYTLLNDVCIYIKKINIYTHNTHTYNIYIYTQKYAWMGSSGVYGPIGVWVCTNFETHRVWGMFQNTCNPRFNIP